jgi:DNA-binding response OmpR family regulator
MEADLDTRNSILVVDDDENILQLLTDALSDRYLVKTASDAVEAADQLQLQSFDLLVLDLNMPVLDGSELLEIFRVQPNFDRVPILVISAFPDLIQRLANAQVQAIVPKPFDLDHLKQVIAETIQYSRRQPDVGTSPSPT